MCNSKGYYGIIPSIIISVFCFSAQLTFAQEESDSTRQLEEVVVKAYAYNKPLKDIPAAVASITGYDLNRFNNTSFVSALNTQPGVRVEERSPGSYRLSIRGSTLRSPFGIRNVKIYFNGMPLTDNGGNTYLNLIDFSAINNLEVIKGPGSSLYGAGTGGVVLLNKNDYQNEKANASIVAGGFGLFRYNLSSNFSSKKFKVSVNTAHQQSDGYRKQSAMNREQFGLRSEFTPNASSSFNLNFLYADLTYQTPGGLTKIQYDTMPSMARPNAEARKAAIYNKTFWGGLSWNKDWNQNFATNIAFFGNLTDFKNPAIGNYEKRDEKSFGFRTENSWRSSLGKLIVGSEFQSGRSIINVGINNQGSFVDNGNKVRLPTNIFFLFLQYDWKLPQDFFLTTGLSYNQITIRYDTLSGSKFINANERKLKSILAPRIALLKKLDANLSTYISYSRGYSPPTTAEVFPSLAIYNPNLKPEYGDNFEVGVKGAWRKMSGSVTFYSFLLNQTIIRLDSAGSDYFTNSGATSQNGVELNYQLRLDNGLRGWVSYSYNFYRFSDYKQGDNDYSNNPVTGVAPNIASIGIDYSVKGFYINSTLNYVDRMPLNDANSVYANEYFIMGLRIGYKKDAMNMPFDLFIGADNLLNQKYSLGNDLNAFGGRYFNPAPTRNFYAGVNLKLK